MDWTMLLAMPLMLLVGLMGDAISRDDDQGAAKANEDEPEDEALAAQQAEMTGDGSGDLLQEAIVADVPAVEAFNTSQDLSVETAEDRVTDFRATLVALLAEEAEAEAPVEEAALVEEPEMPADVADEDVAEADEVGATEEEAEPEAEEEEADEDAPEPVEKIAGFDPLEDVLIIDTVAAEGDEVEMTLVEDGVLVQLAGARVLLEGLSVLPGADAVVALR